MSNGIARWAAGLTRVTGVLLVLLGVIHLIATPFFIGWSSRALHPAEAPLVIAGMRLNHILVGILLIPLGISTCWAAAALQEKWGFRLAVINAGTVLCLPILLVMTMPVQSLDAPLFRLAILVLLLACSAEIVALGGVWALRRRERHLGYDEGMI